MQIAIDGPAGAGKSTVARAVAVRLNYLYIDTGAMYRALTYQVLKMEIDPSDARKVTQVLAEIDLKLVPSTNEFATCEVFVNGQNLTREIREPIVSQHVSQVASHYDVRKMMVEIQQNLAATNHVVMDGRDIATTVLPNADLKIFLDASVKERAKRRLKELESQGHKLDLAELIAELEKRDIQDSTREVSPLRQDSEAIRINTTELDFNEVVEMVLQLAARREKSV